MEIRKFKYNGFSGRINSGLAKYTAEFKEWTQDPGVAVCACSDGKERLIPSFAFVGFTCRDFTEQVCEHPIGYIGVACTDESYLIQNAIVLVP